MDIKDILDSLGLDLSNPEVRRGAAEAIDAILASRNPAAGGLGGSSESIEVELDPDLVMPSVKRQASSSDQDDDIEIEDEENILDQITHNESEDPIDDANSGGNDDESDSDSKSSDDTDGEGDGGSSGKKEDQPETNDEAADEDESASEMNDENDSDEAEQDGDSADADTADDGADSDDSKSEDEDADDDEVDSNDVDSTESTNDDDEEESDFDKDDLDDDEEFDSEDLEDNEDADEEEPDFDEDDLVDDELKKSTEDEEIKRKHEARKIKRDRTLAAARKALADAKAKKVAAGLIRELEKSIEALEALTEAVAKSIADISDAEFSQLINRVLDAIQACGDSDLTFTSEEERAAQVQEIKTDMSNAQTQAELSAEDAAKIRAETQAVKAREKEAAKYTRGPRGSFKGFQEFLNSLYRAIALQVSHEETQDASWSAISRRNGGAGVLQPGKKIQELPNKKIPVIDFYFDCSGSWGQADIEVGKKAVSALADMEANGQIKINIYYFSDEVSQTYEDVAGGGTYAWNYIIKNIIATQATNVIIMTDGDMEGQGKHAAGENNHLKYTVPGYVWYLWRNGENAPRLPRDLKGRGGVQQFSFNAGDV